MAIDTIESLRDFLSNQMERLASGESTPACANANANLAGKMLSTVKMELEYNKMVGATPNITFLGKLNSKKLEKANKEE